MDQAHRERMQELEDVENRDENQESELKALREHEEASNKLITDGPEHGNMANAIPSDALENDPARQANVAEASNAGQLEGVEPGTFQKPDLTQSAQKMSKDEGAAQERQKSTEVEKREAHTDSHSKPSDKKRSDFEFVK